MYGHAASGIRPSTSDGENRMTPIARATAVTAAVSPDCLTSRFHTALDTADSRASTSAAAGITGSLRRRQAAPGEPGPPVVLRNWRYRYSVPSHMRIAVSLAGAVDLEQCMVKGGERAGRMQRRDGGRRDQDRGRAPPGRGTAAVDPGVHPPTRRQPGDRVQGAGRPGLGGGGDHPAG